MQTNDLFLFVYKKYYLITTNQEKIQGPVFQDFLRLEIPTCEGKALKAIFEGFLQNVEILLNEAIKKNTAAGRLKIFHLELKYQCWKHSSHAKR